MPSMPNNASPTDRHTDLFLPRYIDVSALLLVAKPMERFNDMPSDVHVASICDRETPHYYVAMSTSGYLLTNPCIVNSATKQRPERPLFDNSEISIFVDSTL